MLELGLWETVTIVLVISNIVMVGFWIWGIVTIESNIRDDLRRYKEELSFDQLQKAITFYESMKGKK